MSKDIPLPRILDIHRVVVVSRHRADDSGQYSHRMSIVAKAGKEVQHAFVQHRVSANGRIELLLLALRRQFAVQQQVGYFEKTRMLGKLFDGITTIQQHPFGTVDKSYLAIAASGCQEPRVVGEYALFSVKAADIQ